MFTVKEQDPLRVASYLNQDLTLRNGKLKFYRETNKRVKETLLDRKTLLIVPTSLIESKCCDFN